MSTDAVIKVSSRSLWKRWRALLMLVLISFLGLALVQLSSSNADDWLCNFNSYLYNMAEHGDRIVWDTEQFAWTSKMRTAVSEIEAELAAWEEKLGSLGPLFKDIDYGQESVDQKGGWRTMWLRVFTLDTPAVKLFPVTMRHLEAVPGLAGIMFSTLAPHACLQPHVGPSKSILRYHLGLRVPGESEQQRPRLHIYRYHSGCNDMELNSHSPPERMWKDMCGCQHMCECRDCNWMARYSDGRGHPVHTHRWVESGTDFMFDDTYLHSVVNPSTNPRVVLWLDIERPDLGFVARWTNRIFMWAAVRTRGSQGADIATAMQDYFKTQGDFHG